MADQQKIMTDDKMPDELYRIARQKGTEAPFSGKYWDSHEPGVYKCAVCGTILFSSDTKFDSGTGWPSFTQPLSSRGEKFQTVGQSKKSDADGKPGFQKKGAGFTDPVNLEKIILRPDTDAGLERTEVVCKTCGAHLGHVFDDGPQDKGGKRYCINSVCLLLDKKDEH